MQKKKQIYIDKVRESAKSAARAKEPPPDPKSLKRQRTIVLLRRKEDEAWNSLDNNFSYDLCFGSVLRGRSLSGLLKKMRRPLILDIMSYGHVLTRLPIFGGLAVGLEDKISDMLKTRHSEKNIDFIKGNVLSRKTWNMINDWLKAHRASEIGFNMILARPAGGMSYLGDELGVHAALLRRAWQLLSSENGILITEVESGIFGRSLYSWAKQLNMIPGIEAVFSYRPISSALFLIKRKNAPNKLPLMRK